MGKPLCVHGYTDRYTNGRCRPCTIEYHRKRRLAEGCTTYNGDKTHCKRGHSLINARIETNGARRCTECQYGQHLKRYYGLAYDDWKRLWDKQDGRCAACGGPPKATRWGPRLHVDHCHLTGVVRGLLCGTCNMALGLLNDDLHKVRRLEAYLVRWSDPIKYSGAGV